MTESNPGLATKREWLRWRCDALGVNVECTKTVVELFRAASGDRSSSSAPGSSEAGGILFGKWTKRCIRLVAVRPIDGDHKFGSSFLSSAENEASVLEALAQAREDAELRALQPIGLYLSSHNCSMALVDIRIFDRFFDRSFPKARHMVLTIRALPSGEIVTGFLVQERSSTSFRYLAAREVSLPTPKSELPTFPPVSAISTKEIPWSDKPAEIKDAATMLALKSAVSTRESFRHRVTAALNPFPAATATGQKWWTVTRGDVLAAIVVVVLCVAATRAIWLRSNFAPSTRNPMHITNTGAQLRIDWDANIEPVVSATSGSLEIRDGDADVNLPFSRDALRTGSVLYAPKSGTVQVRLKLINGKGTHHEAVIYYINPASAPAETVAALDPAASNGELPVVADPLPVSAASTVAHEQRPQLVHKNKPVKKKRRSR